MIKIEETKKRNYDIFVIPANSEDKIFLYSISLRNHSIANKFSVVIEQIEEMCETISGFEEWYIKLIKKYAKTNDAAIFLSETDNFLKFSEEYVDSKNVNFDLFLNKDKTSTTSIVFYPEDIRNLAIVSTSIKLYSLWFCIKGEDIKNRSIIPANTNKEIFNSLMKPCIDNDVVTKIFQLVRSKTYRSSVDNVCIWSFISTLIFEDPESYMMTIFNFILEKIIALIEIDKNPIPFIIGGIDGALKWLMRTVFDQKVIYGEMFGGTGDVYGSSINKELFYMQCCNDTITKVSEATLSIVETEYNLNDKDFNDFTRRIENVTQIYPAARYIVLPIASQVLKIPYKYLMVIPPKHAVLMGIFLDWIADDRFDKYSIIDQFLLSCPKTNCSFEKSSFKLHQIETVMNDPTPIYGFDSKVFKYYLFSSLVGIVKASKRDLINAIDGSPLKRMSNLSFEVDLSNFFRDLYSSNLKDTFEEMSKIADSNL